MNVVRGSLIASFFLVNEVRSATTINAFMEVREFLSSSLIDPFIDAAEFQNLIAAAEPRGKTALRIGSSWSRNASAISNLRALAHACGRHGV